MAFLKHIFLVVASALTFGLVDKPVEKTIPTASPAPFVLQIEATPSPTARSVVVTQTPKPRASSTPVVVYTPIYTSAPTVTPRPYDACDNIEGIQSIVPSGMYPDGNWKCLVLRQATPTPQVIIQQQSNGEAEALQQKTKLINEATAEYRAKFNALEQQILDIKTKYYADLSANNSGSGIPLEFVQARAQKLLADANNKIAQIQIQEQQLYLDYQSKINAIQ